MRTREERFWRKVDRRGPDECWPWRGGFTRGGYGQASGPDGRPRRANRVAYELATGPIPEGLCVLHRCDNPPCVNPAHLFVGTKRDNTHDMIRKGRMAFGSQKPEAKLDEERVAAIKRLLARGIRTKPIAERFGVHDNTIHNIKHGRRWKHVHVETGGAA